MREQVRPAVLPALALAEELMPPPSSDFAGLPAEICVQSRLFDALVLLAAARQDAELARGNTVRMAAPAIDRLCHELDALLDRFPS